MDVFYDVTEKNKKYSYAIKIHVKNSIVWNMCFKRLVLNVCRHNLSVALNENGKLLNLVETAIAL